MPDVSVLANNHVLDLGPAGLLGTRIELAGHGGLRVAPGPGWTGPT